MHLNCHMVSVVVVIKTAKHKLHLVPCELSIDFLCLVGQEFKEIENQPRLNQNEPENQI